MNPSMWSQALRADPACIGKDEWEAPGRHRQVADRGPAAGGLVLIMTFISAAIAGASSGAFRDGRFNLGLWALLTDLCQAKCDVHRSGQFRCLWRKVKAPSQRKPCCPALRISISVLSANPSST